MKKAVSLFGILAFMLSLMSCGMEVSAANRGQVSGEIIFISDASSMGASKVNKAVWTGIQDYAENTGRACRKVEVEELSLEGRLQAIDDCVTGDVMAIVCVGAGYESAVFEAQHRYPDVMFLLLDGEPYDETDQIYEMTANTHSVLYQEAEAGYLAGYAAVMEGYTNLGFCGGRASPDVIRYGYGFIQGAEAAALEKGFAAGAIEIQYWYAGPEKVAGAVRHQMVQWYRGGTQVIFACDSGETQVTQSVISAAVFQGRHVIGADGDRSSESMTVLFSAVKSYQSSVAEALEALEENGGIWDAERAGWPLHLGAAEDGVALSDRGVWRGEANAYEGYGVLLEALKTGAIQIETGSSRDMMPATTRCAITDWGEG